MVKVPSYNPQISPITPTVQNAPSIPHLDLSGGLSAVNKVGQANEQLGAAAFKISEMLGKHAQEQIQLKNEQVGSQVYTQYARDMQDKLFSDQSETVKINGQDVTRPVGVMNRELAQADGAHQDLDNYYFGTARKSYLDQIPDPTTRSKVSVMMDTHYDTVRGTVMAHQAQQGRKDLINSFSSSVKQQVADSYGAQTPKALGISIDNAIETQINLNKASGADEATANLANQKTTLDVTDNAVMGKLKASGDVNQAYGLLDSVKDKLSPENYDELKTKITKAGNDIEKQLKENITKQTTANRLDLTMQIATGSLKIDNSGQTIRTVAQSDPALAEAMKKSIDSGSKPVDVTNENVAFQENAMDIFRAGKPEEIGNFVVKALDENGNGKISVERLAILVDAAKTRAGNFTSDGTRTPTQIAIDGGMDAVNRWNLQHGNNDSTTLVNYLSAIKANKSPQEAYNNAIRITMAKQHPQTTLMDQPPSIMIDKGSSSRYFINRDTDASKFPYVYDETSKGIVPNKDYKPKRPEKK